MSTMKLLRRPKENLESREVPLPHYRQYDVSDEHTYVVHYRYAEFPHPSTVLEVTSITEKDDGFELEVSSVSRELIVEDWAGDFGEPDYAEREFNRALSRLENTRQAGARAAERLSGKKAMKTTDPGFFLHCHADGRIDFLCDGESHPLDGMLWKRGEHVSLTYDGHRLRVTVFRRTPSGRGGHLERERDPG